MVYLTIMGTLSNWFADRKSCVQAMYVFSSLVLKCSNVQHFKKNTALCTRKQLCLDFEHARREREMANQFSTQSHMSSHICLHICVWETENDRENHSFSVAVTNYVLIQFICIVLQYILMQNQPFFLFIHTVRITSGSLLQLPTVVYI